VRTTRTITASLAAVLGAAALAGPSAADSHKQPDSWYAGKSTIEGSKHSGQQGANDSAKANVYVPPNPQPIQRHVPAASASSSGFDLGSAGIGAAVAIGAFLIALGGAAGLRRARQVQSAATG
jgi:hypothetical protein